MPCPMALLPLPEDSNRDLTIESLCSYPLGHNSSSNEICRDSISANIMYFTFLLAHNYHIDQRTTLYMGTRTTIHLSLYYGSFVLSQKKANKGTDSMCTTYVLTGIICIRPHHPVMAAHDFNRRQTIFMSFRIILSNTTCLSSFPFEDTRVQGSGNARRMPAMTVHLTWMIYLGQSRARAHHALQLRIMKLVKMLSRLIH